MSQQTVSDRKAGLAALILLLLAGAAAQARRVSTLLVRGSGGAGLIGGANPGYDGPTYLYKLSMDMGMAWSPPVPHGSGDFGFKSVGSNDADIHNTLRGASGGPAYDGKAQRIIIHLVGWGAGEKVRCALYDVATEAFVAQTEERATGGINWQTFAFTPPVDIYAAQTYYIVAFADEAVAVRLDPTEPFTGSWKSATYPNFPDPLARTQDWPCGCYCEYDY